MSVCANVSIMHRQPSILRIITRERAKYASAGASDKANIMCTLCIVTWHYLSNVIGCHDNHCTYTLAPPIPHFYNSCWTFGKQVSVQDDDRATRTRRLPLPEAELASGRTEKNVSRVTYVSQIKNLNFEQI